MKNKIKLFTATFALSFQLSAQAGPNPRPPLSSALKTLTLSHLNKEPSIIDSVSLPRTDAPLFRGVSKGHPQHNPAKLLQGFLGINEHFIVSQMLAQALKGEKKPLVDTLLQFKDHFKSQTLFTLKDWPVDAIYGTLFYEVAEYYTKLGMADGLIFTFHDYFKRGIDLNYAIDRLGSVDRNVDAGEYLMPLLIDRSEIDGIIIPSTQHAYFHVSDRGRHSVLVYQNSGCLFKNPADKMIYTCTNKGNFSESEKTYSPYEQPQKPVKIATASAVITTCKTKTTCPTPDADFLNRYSVELAPAFMLDIDVPALSDNHHIVKVFWKE